MAQDTDSPAFLWARERERDRKAAREARVDALQELASSARAALEYAMEHVNPEAVALSSRLAAALTAYYKTKETHETDSSGPGPAQGN
jgi:hypothetical protein